MRDERRKQKVKERSGLESRLNKEFATRAREDKKAFIERKCEDLESSVGDSKKLFQTVKDVTRKWAPTTDVINYENGKTLTESDDIKRRWVEYSSMLYEAKDHQHTYSHGSTEDEPPPLRSEVQKALLRMRNGKSPGTDGIPAEMWKAAGEEGVDLLWRLCVSIWKKNEWPT